MAQNPLLFIHPSEKNNVTRTHTHITTSQHRMGKWQRSPRCFYHHHHHHHHHHIISYIYAPKPSKTICFPCHSYDFQGNHGENPAFFGTPWPEDVQVPSWNWSRWGTNATATAGAVHRATRAKPRTGWSFHWGKWVGFYMKTRLKQAWWICLFNNV